MHPKGYPRATLWGRALQLPYKETFQVKGGLKGKMRNEQAGGRKSTEAFTEPSISPPEGKEGQVWEPGR